MSQIKDTFAESKSFYSGPIYEHRMWSYTLLKERKFRNRKKLSLVEKCPKPRIALDAMVYKIVKENWRESFSGRLEYHLIRVDYTQL